jgi:hypothetical protein
MYYKHQRMEKGSSKANGEHQSQLQFRPRSRVECLNGQSGQSSRRFEDVDRYHRFGKIKETLPVFMAKTSTNPPGDRF